jgi:hypothetical protein
MLLQRSNVIRLQRCRFKQGDWVTTRDYLMSDLPSLNQEDLIHRLSRDLMDSYDEELEMEIEDACRPNL